MVQIYAGANPNPVLKGVIRDLRPIWYLEEIGQPYTRIPLDSAKRENKAETYLKINPLGKVPAMVDGSLSIYESGAICLYLADKYKALSWPPGTQQYAESLQWIFAAVTNIEPHAMRIFACNHFYEKNDRTDFMRTTATGLLVDHLRVADQHVAKSTYLVNGQFGLSDIILSSVLRVLWGNSILEPYPALSAYLQKNYERHAFIRAYELNGCL